LIIPIPILFPSEIPWLAKGVHVLSHVAADYIFQTLLYPVHTTAGLTAKAPSCKPCKVNVLLSHPRKLPQLPNVPPMWPCKPLRVRSGK
jgi:hypothetical protein